MREEGGRERRRQKRKITDGMGEKEDREGGRRLRNKTNNRKKV